MLIVNRSTLAAYLLAILLPMLSAGFPIGLGLTTNRIGLILVVVASALMRFRFRMSRGMQQQINVLTIGMGFAAAWGYLSYLLSPFPHAASIAPIISWLLILVGTVGVCVIASELDDKGLYLVIVIAIAVALAASLAIVAILVQTFGLSGLSRFNDIRHALNRYGPGLSRMFNGMFVLHLVPIAVSIGAIRIRGFAFLSACLASALFIVLSVLVGSRQTLLGVLGYVLALAILARGFGVPTFLSVSRGGLRIPLLVGTGMALVWLVRPYVDLGAWFADRFLDRTAAQVSDADGYSRLYAIKVGAQYTVESPLLGIGPGAFTDVVGMAAHNGYIGVATEFGLPVVIILTGTLSLVALNSGRQRHVMSGVRCEVACAAAAFLIAYASVTLQFNDLLRDASLWSTLGLLVGVSFSFRRKKGRRSARGRIVRNGIVPDSVYIRY